jgi:uncharacterized protein
MRSSPTRRQFLLTAAAAPFAAAAFGAPAAPLPQRILGKTGVKVPILGLGADGIMTDATDRDEVLRFLTGALDAGITFFDTAYMYGKNGQSEKNLGLLMRGPRRKEAFLATKTGSRTYDGAMQQVETSLKRLGTDRLDLLQVHHVTARDDVAAFGKKNGVLAAFARLRDQKVVRFTGLTGHANDPQVAEALRLYDWDTFMCFANPARFARPALEEQLPAARKKNLGLIGMKAFGGRPNTLIGAEPGRADAASLLTFALSQPVALVIVGVTTTHQLTENLEVARTFAPMPADRQEALRARIDAGTKPWER